MAEPSREERILATAERVHEAIQQCGVDSAVIGAIALAVHGYPRATEDVDLATDTDPFTKLREIKAAIERLGLDATLNEPDADDPLGGVITAGGSGVGTVQIVNFYNPLSRQQNPGGEAIRTALTGALIGTSLKVVDLPHLIALKLYGGGAKGQLDVTELLERNDLALLPEIKRVCARFGLLEPLQTILRSLKLG